MSLEDEIMFIYNEVKEKGLQEKFDKQLEKMRLQSKHDPKKANARRTYDLSRIYGWNPNNE